MLTEEGSEKSRELFLQLTSWLYAALLRFLKPHRKIGNRLQIDDDLRGTLGIQDFNEKFGRSPGVWS